MSQSPGGAGSHSRRHQEYPPRLAQAELQALGERRKRAGLPDPLPEQDPWAANGVGLALSGGGIRSATFGLGLIQGLAYKGLLPRIDLMSTVSGGCYVGSFLGRLIQSKGEPKPGEALPVQQAVLDLATGAEGPSFPLRWLRENGYYLAPNGAGDEGLMAAVILRNWATTWGVLALFLMALLLALNALRLTLVPLIFGGMHSLVNSPELSQKTFQLLSLVLPRPWPRLGDHIWWSPWCVIPGLALLLVVIPPAVLYWIQPTFQDPKPRRTLWLRTLAMLLLGILFLSLSIFHVFEGVLVWVGVGLGLCSLAMAVHQRRAWTGAGRIVKGTEGLIAQVQWHFSHQLYGGLLFLALTTALALVDSAGQTIYAVMREGGWSGLKVWAGGLACALLALVSLSRRAAAILPSRKEQVRLPKTILAWTAALVLSLTVLLGLGAATQALTWGFQRPTEPGQSEAAGSVLLRGAHAQKANLTVCLKDMPARATLNKTITRDTTGVTVSLPAEQNLLLEIAPSTVEPVANTSAPHAGWLLSSLAVAAVLTWICGRRLSFLNKSSMATFYQNRLARTFLGASNPLRREKDTSVREVMPGDDVLWTDYKPHANGGPLHIVNVTINETVDGKSQVQQRDRKGLGLAIGPCGVSGGVRHHATWASPKLKGVQGQDASKDLAQAKYAIFPGHAIQPEPLTLSQWMGISGAAFNTGMGYRTSLGLSLLCGLFNIRLGYWWDSGLSNQREKGLWGRLASFFPVQAHLVDELLARFPGTAAQLWFLSDGGHFENSGIYEMARRRVRYIVYSDAGADSGYVLDDLANLGLKLRADFGAELEFFTSEEIHKFHHPALVTWDKLKRDPATNLTPGHATLARIRYPEGGESLIVVLKPSLTGDEPLDLRYYNTEHPDFPQESTMDQFFDEPQWESYRKLGEHIALEVFGKVAKDVNLAADMNPFAWMPESAVRK